MARTAQSVFKTCAACHGDSGQGRFDIQAPGIAGLPKWYIVSQIKKFKNGGRGKHHLDYAGLRMRPMARSIYKSDIDLISDYISKLPRAKAASTFNDEMAGDAAKGKNYYNTCLACHGPTGDGMEALKAPPLKGMADWYLFSQLKKFKSRQRGYDPVRDLEGTTQMAPMANTLPDDQAIRDVIEYINTF